MLTEREIAESFAGYPLLFIQPEEYVEFFQDRRLVEVLFVKAVEAGSFVIAGEVEVIAARRRPDKADLRRIGAAAAIGAAGHPEDDARRSFGCRH